MFCCCMQVQYEEKRVEHYHREKNRWDHMEQVSKKHEQALDQRRAAVGTFSHRNQSGEHFDIITLQHRPTPGGERLRAAVRLQVVCWHLQELHCKCCCRGHEHETAPPSPSDAQSAERMLAASCLQDQSVMQRADSRAQTLYSKGQSVAHNIITGQPVVYPRPAGYYNNQ